MTKLDDASQLYDVEHIIQSLDYEKLNPDELFILNYKPFPSKDPLGFYGPEDCPDGNEVLLAMLNCELKNFLIFYGAPAPGSELWIQLVKKHRKKPLNQIFRDYLMRQEDRINVQKNRIERMNRR